MKKITKIILLTSLVSSKVVLAASGVAQSLQTVEKAISIVQQSDLNFGTAVQGDAALTVAPDTVENSSNASFLVSGEANKSYNITLPVDGDVVMVTNETTADRERIPVNNFQSYPAAGSTVLDSSGEQTVFVGATRNAILFNQDTSSYVADFTVTVVY